MDQLIEIFEDYFLVKAIFSSIFYFLVLYNLIAMLAASKLLCLFPQNSIDWFLYFAVSSVIGFTIVIPESNGSWKIERNKVFPLILYKNNILQLQPFGVFCKT